MYQPQEAARGAPATVPAVLKGFVLAVLLFLAWSPRATAGNDFAVPPPTLLEQLRHDRHTGEWLRVTTGDASYDVHVRTFGSAGLGDISGRRSQGPFPESIAWTSIERIEVVHSRFRSGQVQGIIAGGALGGLAPILVRRDLNTAGSLPGLVLGAVAGGWLGGRFGERAERTELIYVARMAPAPTSGAETPPAPARDSVPAMASPPATTTEPRPALPATTMEAPSAQPTTAESEGGIAPEILNACARIKPSNLLRIQGDFGRFEGRVAHASPEGLDGLRPTGGGAAAEPEGLVTWDHVYTLDKHGTHGRQAAIGTGIGLGMVGLLVGMVAAAVVAAGGSGDNPATAFILGPIVGFGAGAVIGGFFGSLVPRWERVYERNETAPADTQHP